VPAGGDLAGGAPAPVPVSAPAPASTDAATGGAPDPNTAKTGIDWNQMLSDFGPPARTALEVGRLIPGWGLLAGFASDSLSFASDLASIPNSKNARFATGLIVFRNFVNIENNALGHVLYVNQLVQDGLAGSVVGAEFTPLTAAANEVLSGVKVALDEVQMGTDIVVEVEALYEANHAPDSAEAEKWRQLADGYAANILGDVVNTVLDVISLASAGAANTAPVEEAKLPLTLAGAFLEHAAPNIISAINNILGVWLGSGVTAGRHAASGAPAAGSTGPGPAPATGTGPATAPAGAGARAVPAVQRLGEGLPGGPDGRPGQAASLRAQAVAYDMAGGFVEAEAPVARTTFDGINAVIDTFEAYAEDQVAQIDAVVGALTGGKSAFQFIRDAVTAGLDDMNRKVAMVQQLGASATNAQASAKSIAETCDGLLGSIDGLVMPSVHIPEVDLGEGIVASAASAVANTAAEAADAALELAISGVSAALETAKDAVRAPILDIKAHAGDIGEWLAILATKCTEMIATLHAHISSFSEGLGHCSNVTEVIDLIIGQVSDLTGMPRFTVQDMRNTWNNVGGYIDQFAALGPQLHEQAAALREQADQLAAGSDNGPTFALPPGPPTNPGEDGGAAEGAAA
jgi:enamine deaminase RidA (YjgF/YER057c/UK114 family)